jgi:putative ABC transport system permease protein
VTTRSAVLLVLTVLPVAQAKSQAKSQAMSSARDPVVGVAVERRFAATAGLRVGDTVTLASTAGTPAREGRIEAIYEPAPDPSTVVRRDFHIRLHLSDLADMLGQPDRVDRIGVVLRPGINADTAAAELNRTAFGYEVTPSAVVASRSSTTFLVVSRFHRAIAFISVLASSVFLLCLMLLKVEERRRDVAMLRFTGISRRTVFIALVLESAVIAFAGSMIGAGLAAIASAAVNTYYQRAYSTALVFSEFTSASVLFAVCLSIGLGLCAGAVAAWRMVRTAPVELWGRAA